MGSSYSGGNFNPGWERGRDNSVRRERNRRMKIADKIVMAVIDRINQVVIRPGPHPEERECYDMAQEIRALSPDLAKLVAQILKIEEDG